MRAFRSLFSCCRSHWRLKGLRPTGFKIPTTLASIAAIALVFASSGLGALYAWAAGSPHGWAMASLMVVMAIGLEVCKPLSVASAFSAFRSLAVVRGSALALLAIVAVTYSLTAELSLMASARGDLLRSVPPTPK